MCSTVTKMNGRVFDLSLAVGRVFDLSFDQHFSNSRTHDQQPN